MDTISHLYTSGKDYAELTRDEDMSQNLFETRYNFNTLFLYQNPSDLVNSYLYSDLVSYSCASISLNSNITNPSKL